LFQGIVGSSTSLAFSKGVLISPTYTQTTSHKGQGAKIEQNARFSHSVRVLSSFGHFIMFSFLALNSVNFALSSYLIFFPPCQLLSFLQCGQRTSSRFVLRWKYAPPQCPQRWKSCVSASLFSFPSIISVPSYLSPN